LYHLKRKRILELKVLKEQNNKRTVHQLIAFMLNTDKDNATTSTVTDLNISESTNSSNNMGNNSNGSYHEDAGSNINNFGKQESSYRLLHYS
jgi:hypothetical protein